jgi:hypothetical protein
MKRITLNLLFACSYLLPLLSFSQVKTSDSFWGMTKGKYTGSTVIENEKRYLHGAFSYSGTDPSPSTMVVKGNYKMDKFHGPFSLKWKFTAGYEYSGEGTFHEDSLDGKWTFIVNGFYNGERMNRKILLTFSRGNLIQGTLTDNLNKGSEKFETDGSGLLNGLVIERKQESGYEIEIGRKYVHGVKVLEYKKDVATKQYLSNPKTFCDTNVVKSKNFNTSLQTFIGESTVYELTERKKVYSSLFENNSYLGYFREGYGSQAPFFKTQNIILPSIYEIKEYRCTSEDRRLMGTWMLCDSLSTPYIQGSKRYYCGFKFGELLFYTQPINAEIRCTANSIYARGRYRVLSSIENIPEKESRELATLLQSEDSALIVEVLDGDTYWAVFYPRTNELQFVGNMRTKFVFMNLVKP